MSASQLPGRRREFWYTACACACLRRFPLHVLPRTLSGAIWDVGVTGGTIVVSASENLPFLWQLGADRVWTASYDMATWRHQYLGLLDICSSSERQRTLIARAGCSAERWAPSWMPLLEARWFPCLVNSGVLHWSILELYTGGAADLPLIRGCAPAHTFGHLAGPACLHSGILIVVWSLACF